MYVFDYIIADFFPICKCFFIFYTVKSIFLIRTDTKHGADRLAYPSANLLLLG